MRECDHVVLYYDRSCAEFLNANKDKYYGANDNGFSSSTATATASFYFKPRPCVKVKKCGVHLLYAQEAEKFGFVEPYDWEKRQSKLLQHNMQYKGSQPHRLELFPY